MTEQSPKLTVHECKALKEAPEESQVRATNDSIYVKASKIILDGTTISEEEERDTEDVQTFAEESDADDGSETAEPEEEGAHGKARHLTVNVAITDLPQFKAFVREMKEAMSELEAERDDLISRLAFERDLTDRLLGHARHGSLDIE